MVVYVYLEIMSKGDRERRRGGITTTTSLKYRISNKVTTLSVGIDIASEPFFVIFFQHY